MDSHQSDLVALAQGRQIEANVWRSRLAEAEADNERLRDFIERVADAEFDLTGDLINACNRVLRGEQP